MGKKDEMRLMRDQGMKYREIAEKFGVSQQYVAIVCGKYSPHRFVPIGDKCIYPNLRKWMNENKITRREFLRRMSYEGSSENYVRLGRIITGERDPSKTYIDNMIRVTGLTYEKLFAEE